MDSPSIYPSSSLLPFLLFFQTTVYLFQKLNCLPCWAPQWLNFYWLHLYSVCYFFCISSKVLIYLLLRSGSLARLIHRWSCMFPSGSTIILHCFSLCDINSHLCSRPDPWISYRFQNWVILILSSLLYKLNSLIKRNLLSTSDWLHCDTGI